MGSTVIGRSAALLRRAPGFRSLFLATLGSGLGSMLAVIALTVDVYDRTGSGTWVAGLLIADFLPTIAIGLLLGPLLDRFSRRGLMIASDLVRLAAFAALPFAGGPGVIVALALVVGFASGFFRPAAYAGMPNLVAEEDLPYANSLFQTVENLTWMVGPLLGGILLAASGPDVPYVVNAATFLVSALLVARIPAERLRSEDAFSRGHWHDLAEGFAHVARSREVLTVIVAWTIVMFGEAGVNVAEVFLVRDAFDAGNAGLGLMMGGTGLGLVVGSAVAAGLITRASISAVYGGALVVMGAGYGAAAMAPGLELALPAVAVAGLGNGIATVCNPMLVQRGTPDRVRGRVFTVVMSVNYVFLGIGMAVAGPVTDAAGPRWVWGVAASLFLVAGAIGAWLARGVRAAAPEHVVVVAAAGPIVEAGPASDVVEDFRDRRDPGAVPVSEPRPDRSAAGVMDEHGA
jgi:MFS family permease